MLIKNVVESHMRMVVVHKKNYNKLGNKQNNECISECFTIISFKFKKENIL